MPSPRAVLADIGDLGLDPMKHHTGVKASGRLKEPTAGHVDVEPVTAQTLEDDLFYTLVDVDMCEETQQNVVASEEPIVHQKPKPTKKAKQQAKKSKADSA